MPYLGLCGTRNKNLNPNWLNVLAKLNLESKVWGMGRTRGFILYWGLSSIALFWPLWGRLCPQLPFFASLHHKGGFLLGMLSERRSAPWKSISQPYLLASDWSHLGPGPILVLIPEPRQVVLIDLNLLGTTPEADSRVSFLWARGLCGHGKGRPKQLGNCSWEEGE